MIGPPLEAVAAGIATADFGADNAVLMGVSAARLLGAIPRALAVAIVAVPKQRAARQLTDRDALVRFVARDTDRLDAELLRTELGRTLVTTPEQTVLDLAHRPGLGDAETEVPAAIRTLYRRCDPNRLADLAAQQRLRAALRRAAAIAGQPCP
ncbi:type IV toxin-antitoxin system AbiEi family antitoxin [Nocardia altamirensis]|uniref:type IV toxin-antitoxin system AbiEi family antitoxin n=1 Tax=Nocardia altamirensis TaxID=472158 RepID=UPI00084076D7|nr:type IV toxin-antitoxin system AbiEi family antitoxin [Nocardia altamirensis]